MDDKKIKLLVVDDVADIREHLVSYFSRRDFIVFAAGSAEEALPIIKGEIPDLMLLDMNLPGMTGMELVKLVRGFNKTIKVIMVSGYEVDPEHEHQFQEFGILEFIHKPIGLAELELAIRKALK